MNRINGILLLLLTGLTSQIVSAQWVSGVYAVGAGQPISEVPWSKLTHMIVCCAHPAAAGGLSESFLAPYSYPELRSMAQANGVKLILSIDGASPYWAESTNPSNVARYVTNIVNYINNNAFDGVDLDWETSVVPSQYIDLITRLRSALPTKLITMDGGNWEGLPTVGAATHQYLNQINVMCYDMANGNGFSWHTNALIQAGNPMVMTCDWRVRSFQNLGVPNGKIGIGLPYYGYAWNGATGPQNPAGAYSHQQYQYNTIMRNPTFWNGGLNKRWDSVYKADYLSVAATNQMVTYTDTTSAAAAVSWASSQGFGGYMLLYLQQEYMSGAGGDARFPLTAALYNALRGVAPPPPPPPPVPPPPPPAEPPPPPPPPAGTGGYLSDLTWVSATNGWGTIMRDRSINGNTLNLRGVTYAKGLGVHSTSQIVYSLGGACSSFQATVGVDNEVGGNGSVVFRVLADGITLYQSGTMSGSTPAANVNVSLTGRSQLTLQAQDGGNGINFDHADWANASITCGTTPPPVPPAPNTYFVSDLNSTSATNGWGTIRKDASIEGRPITLQGSIYTKGLGVHANSQVTYNLGAKCSAFQATLGIDGEVGTAGSVVFRVVADGATLYQSPTMTGSSAAQTINVPLSGRYQIALIAEDSGGGINFDHADWASARLTCTSAP